jgi:hypothetical protein
VLVSKNRLGGIDLKGVNWKDTVELVGIGAQLDAVEEHAQRDR